METTPLPKYKCHKEVFALKIKSVVLDADLATQDGNRETDGSAYLTPENDGYGQIKVNADYVRKHNPQSGGYWVRYADGYESFSPADVFEAGYSSVS